MSRLFSLVLATCLAPASGAADSFDTLRKDYEAEIRPLLAQFCLKCHSTEKLEGDLDLAVTIGLE